MMSLYERIELLRAQRKKGLVEINDRNGTVRLTRKGLVEAVSNWLKEHKK